MRPAISEPMDFTIRRPQTMEMAVCGPLQRQLELCAGDLQECVWKPPKAECCLLGPQEALERHFQFSRDPEVTL